VVRRGLVLPAQQHTCDLQQGVSSGAGQCGSPGAALLDRVQSLHYTALHCNHFIRGHLHGGGLHYTALHCTAHWLRAD
jgi:hypothetical protein